MIPILEPDNNFLTLDERFRQLPKEFRTEVRKQLRPVGRKLVQQARANAGWSSQIPASIGYSVMFAGKKPGIKVFARRGKARHARVFEGLFYGTFRHPVFGSRDTWVSESARPFLYPAVVSEISEIVSNVENALAKVHSDL